MSFFSVYMPSVGTKLPSQKEIAQGPASDNPPNKQIEEGKKVTPKTGYKEDEVAKTPNK